MDNIHVITYGNRLYARSKARLIREAEDFGLFKTITSYGPESLDQDFVEEYGDILKNKKGGGYWIWKIQIIKQKLRDIKDGEFLIYLDAGCSLNKRGIEKFKQYIDLLKTNESGYGMLRFQMGHREREWTTKEIFNAFGIDRDSEHAISGQYVGTILVMRKCDHLENIINHVFSIMKQDKYLITDKYNAYQAAYFKDNRHDQSILSLTSKQLGSVVIKDETYFNSFGRDESIKYPFWATRIR